MIIGLLVVFDVSGASLRLFLRVFLRVFLIFRPINTGVSCYYIYSTVPSGYAGTRLGGQPPANQVKAKNAIHSRAAYARFDWPKLRN